jgi:beta-lactamase superfamily II metal-dependent hydrolase
VTCQITFLPVGNADSIVIQSENSTIIVDLGKLDVLEDWLHNNEISKIDRIYITHAHGDHFPSIIRFVDFIINSQEKITIEKVHLPYRVIEIARKKVMSDENNPRVGKLRLALKRISEWDEKYMIKFTPILRDGEQYSEGALKIKALHPSQNYTENHIALTNSKLNEISTVLRVDYGKFSALLLADIEGAGLTELLNLLKLNSRSTDFIANIVKMPHHGAYPKNGKDLEELLALIDAELAILSVGSKNTYGHVEPELFKALLELQQDGDRRLPKFICTEVTRTCVHSASDRLTMGKSGLNTSKKCAGEITVIADLSGTWELKTETDHLSEVASFKYAACNENGDLI